MLLKQKMDVPMTGAHELSLGRGVSTFSEMNNDYFNHMINGGSNKQANQMRASKEQDL